ncbi:arsenate reductase (glutaredoxin) [Flavobacteriales bacterium]|nr:arsenate reductase (glutaredoxin) [Flavobacteriales bacterium]
MKYYHNPRCRKSREGLSILEEKGISPEIILYLNDNPSKSELIDVISKLGIKPIDLVRKSEKIYKEKYKSCSLNDRQVIEMLVENPILIERPIFINEDKGVIGRPPENVLEII